MIKTYGTVFFSAKSITGNYSHFADSLQLYYRYPSLLPKMIWIDSVPPLTPVNLKAVEIDSSVVLSWEKPLPASDGDTAYKYVVYRFDYSEQVNLEYAWHILKILVGNQTVFTDTTLEKGKLQYTYVVTALDRLNNESNPAVINLSLNRH